MKTGRRHGAPEAPSPSRSLRCLEATSTDPVSIIRAGIREMGEGEAARPQGDDAMSKVAMIGTLTCQDGKADEMAAVLTSMVEAAKEEPGTEIYSYHRGEGNTFWFFALMSDQEAMQSHGQGEAMKAAMASFGPLMAEPPQMSPATPVAAIGFDI